MPMASAPMTMQAGQMAYRPMVPMAPMTGMTAPYVANQPMNVRQIGSLYISRLTVNFVLFSPVCSLPWCRVSGREWWDPLLAPVGRSPWVPWLSLACPWVLASALLPISSWIHSELFKKIISHTHTFAIYLSSSLRVQTGFTFPPFSVLEIRSSFGPSPCAPVFVFLSRGWNNEERKTFHSFPWET